MRVDNTHVDYQCVIIHFVIIIYQIPRILLLHFSSVTSMEIKNLLNVRNYYNFYKVASKLF